MKKLNLQKLKFAAASKIMKAAPANPQQKNVLFRWKKRKFFSELFTRNFQLVCATQKGTLL
jgi:hypothetical protein